MIFGMTNAGGAGGMKYVTGSFTSSNTETQKSFTVSGLDFEPKIVAVFGGSPAEVGSAGIGTSAILISSFADIENGVGFYTYQPSTATGAYKVAGSKNLKATKTTDGYTITASSYFFSNISSGKGYRGTFKYYIYG